MSMKAHCHVGTAIGHLPSNYRVIMNDKAIPHSCALSRPIRPTPHHPNRSRKDALRRSHKTLTAAVRQFRAFPWGRSRAALELAMEAVQRADLLPADPRDQRDGQLHAWEKVWLAAQLALQQITPDGTQP
jgi:hypothetical protein